MVINKKVFGVLLFIFSLFFFNLICVSAVPAYNASNVIYRCGAIDVAGSYLMNQSINSSGGCLTITADNIEINGSGFAVGGNIVATGSGDGANGYTNLTIRDMTLNGSVIANGVYSDFGSGGSGGTVNVINSNLISIYSNGDYSAAGSGGSGGTVNVINSNLTSIYVNGEMGLGFWGGNGGNVTLINTTAISIFANGGVDDHGGSGGMIFLTDSVITTINAKGGYGPLSGGDGGSVSLVDSVIFLGGVVNLTAGVRLLGGSGINGVLLNSTSFVNDYGKIKFGYVSDSLNDTFDSLLSIQDNFVFVDSVSFPSYNVSSNITLNNIPTGKTNYTILKNGEVCSDCFNFTELSGNVTFNVTSWSNYTISWDEPTCSDGIKNGGETGLDCGGSCGSCSVTGRAVGSSGGRSVPMVYALLDLQFGNRLTKNLKEQDKIVFNVSNQSHKLTLNSFNGQSVNVTIESTPRNYIVKINEMIAVDVNDDGVNDISVGYLKYTGGFAQLEIVKLNLQGEVVDVNVVDQFIEKNDSGNKILFISSIVLLVLILLFFILFFIVSRRNR